MLAQLPPAVKEIKRKEPGVPLVCVVPDEVDSRNPLGKVALMRPLPPAFQTNRVVGEGEIGETETEYEGQTQGEQTDFSFQGCAPFLLASEQKANLFCPRVC